jgi:AP2-associated kinase
MFSRSDKQHRRDGSRTSFDFGRSRKKVEGDALLLPTRTDAEIDYDRANISSDIDFLRAKEEEEQNRKREKRLSSGPKHVKRSSLSSLSVSGKALLGGRFGDAFRRFENNTSQERRNRSPSPEGKLRLTPVTGSEVTELSDDGHGYFNREDVSPEMRRELERRQMLQEEQRVANAAAQYRLKLAERGDGGIRGGDGKSEVTRSSSIQNKVQALIKDTQKPPPPKTASGYGRYTATEPSPQQAKQLERPMPERPAAAAPPSHDSRPRVPPKDVHPSAPRAPSSSAQFSTRQASKPAPPPKPKNLRTGNYPESPVVGSNDRSAVSYDQSQNNQPPSPNDDWEKTFSRRYPSLSGLELVETEIGLPKVPVVRTKEV